MNSKKTTKKETKPPPNNSKDKNKSKEAKDVKANKKEENKGQESVEKERGLNINVKEEDEAPPAKVEKPKEKKAVVKEEIQITSYL